MGAGCHLSRVWGWHWSEPGTGRLGLDVLACCRIMVKRDQSEGETSGLFDERRKEKTKNLNETAKNNTPDAFRFVA